MRVGYIQMEPRVGDPEGNRRLMAQALETVQADLVVLPELANAGYNYQSAADAALAAEAVPGGATIRLWREVASGRGLSIVGGFAERGADGGLYNAAALVTPDGRVLVYRKIHLFGNEQAYFRQGDEPPRVHAVNGVRLGVMICFDWAFPELARCLALQGADILCHPSNIVTGYAMAGMRQRSIENRVFSVTANRTGTETGEAGRLRFRGDSQVVAPDGAVLVQSGADAVESRVVEIDPAQARDKRLAGLHDLFASRRPECYGALMEAPAPRA